MRLVALYTGGKDSTRALLRARAEGHDVVALLTMAPARDDSYMFHAPTVELTGLHGEALGIPAVRAPTSGIEGEELEDLRAALRGVQASHRVEGAVSGALRSRYQKDRIDRICADLGLASLAPLWQLDAEEHLRSIIREGWKVIFSAVAADGLTEEWLGARLDPAALGRLLALRERRAINIEGEGGEYETLVLWAPGFSKELAVEFRRVWRGTSGYLQIASARLVPADAPTG